MTSPLRAALRATLVAGAALALGGCNSITLFQSSFNAQPTGAPPTTAQAVGTMQLIDGAPGAIQVVGPVPGSSENWVRISRASVANNTAPITVLQGTLAQTFADGNYGFLAAIYIPSGSGLASVEFDTGPLGSPATTSFLHLDFLEDGTIRFDDNPAKTCCHYPHDQFFTLSVPMEVTASGATAHVTLLGTGVSSGTFDYPIQQPNFARQYGAIRLWMGYPWTGSFDATDLLVTRQK